MLTIEVDIETVPDLLGRRHEIDYAMHRDILVAVEAAKDAVRSHYASTARSYLGLPEIQEDERRAAELGEMAERWEHAIGPRARSDADVKRAQNRERVRRHRERERERKRKQSLSTILQSDR